MSTPWKWERDQIFAVWEANYRGTWLYVRRRGNHRFSWQAGYEFVTKTGIDEITGHALSLVKAKAMAEQAALLLGRSPNAGVAEVLRHDFAGAK